MESLASRCTVSPSKQVPWWMIWKADVDTEEGYLVEVDYRLLTLPRSRSIL